MVVILALTPPHRLSEVETILQGGVIVVLCFQESLEYSGLKCVELRGSSLSGSTNVSEEHKRCVGDMSSGFIVDMKVKKQIIEQLEIVCGEETRFDVFPMKPVNRLRRDTRQKRKRDEHRSALSDGSEVYRSTS